MPTREDYYNAQVEIDKLLKEAKRKGYTASPETSSRIDKFLAVLGWTEKQTAQRFVDPILSVALAKRLDVDLPTRTAEPGEVSTPELPHLAIEKDPAIKGYLSVLKKYGILEDHPILQTVAGFGASIAGDPLTYAVGPALKGAKLGLKMIPKVAEVAPKIIPKIERTKPIKFFVPAAGAPEEYKLARQLAYHAGQQETETAVLTARELAKKVSKPELRAMTHIYEATAPSVKAVKELEGMTDFMARQLAEAESNPPLLRVIKSFGGLSIKAIKQDWPDIIPILKRYPGLLTKSASEPAIRYPLILSKSVLGRNVGIRDIQRFRPDVHDSEDLITKLLDELKTGYTSVYAIRGKIAKQEVAKATQDIKAQIEEAKRLLEIPITKEEIENLASTGRVSRERIEAWLNMTEPAFEAKWAKTARPFMERWRGESKVIAKELKTRGLLSTEIEGYVPHVYKDFESQYIKGKGWRKGRVIPTLETAKGMGYEPMENMALWYAMYTSGAKRAILHHDFVENALKKFGTPVHPDEIRSILQARGLPADTPIIMWKGTVRAKPAPTEEVAKARRTLMEMFKEDVVDIRDVGPEAIAGVKELLGKDAVAYIIPNRGIYEDLIKSSKMFKPDEAITWLGSGYDNIIGKWKGLATFSVAFHIRNITGNLYNSWLGGLQPQHVTQRFYEAVKILRGAEGAVGDVPYSEIRRMGKDFGFARYGGFFWNEILNDIEKAVYAPKIAKANPLKWSRELGTMAESISKTMLFIDRLHKGDNHHQAFLHTVKYLFDYSPVTLTNFERKAVRRVIPFYTWMRKNIPLQIEAVAKQPWKIKAAMRLPEITPVPEREKEILPDYFETSFAVRLPVETEDGKPIYVLPDLPPSDLLEIGVVNDVLQRVSPAIALLGTLNENFFKAVHWGGKGPNDLVRAPWAVMLPGPVKDLLDVHPPRRDGTVEYRMPAKYVYLMNKFVPPLPRFGKMLEGDWWAVARFFYGVVPQDVERLERAKVWEERRQKGKEKKRERELRYEIRE